VDPGLLVQREIWREGKMPVPEIQGWATIIGMTEAGMETVIQCEKGGDPGYVSW